MATDEQIREMHVDYWMAMICLKPKTELDSLVGDPADFGIDGEPCPELLMRRWRAALFASREELDAAIKATFDHAVSRGYEWPKKWVFQPVRCRIVQKGGVK